MRRLARLALVLLTAAAISGEENLNTAKGFNAASTYDFSSVEAVNAFNGSIILNIPLGQTYPVGPLLKYSFGLVYTGNNWETQENSWLEWAVVPPSDPRDQDDPVKFEWQERSSTYNEPLERGAIDGNLSLSAGLGWRVTMGQLSGSGDPYVYTAPDGSRHTFSDRLGTEAGVGANANTFYTNDSSYLRLRKQSDGSAQIDFPDGTVQSFDVQGRLTEIRDGLPRTAAGTYPNWVRYEYGPRAGEYTVITITDSIGRQHVLTFRRMAGVGGIEQDNEHPYGNLGTTEDPDAYDVLVSASVAAFGTTTPATYELEYLDADNDASTFEAVPISRKYTLRQDCSVPSAVHVPLLSAVNQPEGQSFTVTYDRGNTVSFSNPDPVAPTDVKPGISRIVIQEGGSGYDSSASVSFSDGGGSGATGTPVIGIGGAITGIQIHTAGSYTFAPTVTINGNGSGSGARAIAAVCAQVHGFSGNPTSLRLPTGGSIDWQYRLWKFASGSAARHCDIGNGACMKAATESEGVATRLQRDAGAPRTVLSKRTYASEFQGTTDLSFHTQVTTVKDYEGFNTNDGSGGTVVSTVLNYFSAGTETSKASTDTFPGEYGLPFTRSQTFGEATLPNPDPNPQPGRPVRYLSTQTFAGTSTLKQSTYVAYEGDNPAVTDLPCCNRRRRDESTLFAEDATWVATLRDDFNGLGSYRKTTKKSSIDTHEKVTFTNYTMGATLPYDPSPAAASWATSVLDSISSTENGLTSKAEYYFAVPQLLSRKRLLRNISTGTPARDGADVIVAYTYDDHGYLESETYHGGDSQQGQTAVGLDALNSATLDLGTADYTINHTRTPVDTAKREWGEQSSYSNGLTTRDVGIDQNTGLEKYSLDPAAVKTEFGYDSMGRLKSVRPVGRAWTAYTYPTSSSSLLQVKQFPNGATTGTPLTHSSYEFDGLGRVISESRLIPKDVTATRYTTYDALGRRATTSDFSTAASPPVTEYGYDALGRLTSTTTPDDATVTFNPVGFRKNTRTVKVATCADIAPANCHAETSTWKSGADASTIETFDGSGRLSEVEEPGGTKTTYGYDVNDRLVSVSMAGGATSQSRTFVYDGRGFLTSETHPESGTTTYTYDARGHVLQRTSPTATVTYAYDGAERPVSVSHGTQVLKEFTFGTATADKSAGKLTQAIRYNRGTPEGDITVTETYQYSGDSAGRLASRSTNIGAQTFTDGYTYDVLDAVKTVTYPACSGCGAPAAPSRTVTSRYDHGFLTGVDKYTWTGQAITYWPNGMVKEVKHVNAGRLLDGPVDTYNIDTATGMARPSSITFSGFCNDFTVGELASVSVTANSSANLTATTSGAATTFQWFEVSASGAETLLSGQSTNRLTTTIGTTPRRFFVRAGNGTCTIDSNVATVTPNACPAPDTTVTMLSTLTRGGSASASVPHQDAAYVWTITGGSITSGKFTRTVQFVVDCDALTVLASVSVTPACGSTAPPGSKSASTSARTTVTLSAFPGAIPQGASKEITVELTGTAPWAVTWSDTGSSSSESSPGLTRTVTPAATTTYTATATDANGCTASQSITVTVTVPVPAGVVATATSTSQVQLSWTMPGQADTFEVERRAPGGAFVLHHTTATAATSVTLAATPDTAYLYRVRAVKSGTRSAPSGADLATTVVFGAALTPGSSVLSALDVTRLRTAVNAVRALWSSALAPAVFTDPSLQNVIAKAVHLTELRAVLNEARQGLALPPVVYSTTPAAGQVIAAADINDLRGGVR